MGLNVTVMSGVTWARTLPSLSVLHGPERYRYDRCYVGLNVAVVWCYMGPNVTVITGVTWARTLPSLPVLHGPERYRHYRCYMFPNFTIMSGVTWARTLPSLPVLHGPRTFTVKTDVTWAEHYCYDRCYISYTLLLSLPVLHGPKSYRHYRCYMDPNVTVMTDVIRARTLPL